MGAQGIWHHLGAESGPLDDSQQGEWNPVLQPQIIEFDQQPGMV